MGLYFNDLDLQSNLFFNLLSLIGDDDWYEASKKISEGLNTYSTTVLFNKDYFDMIKYIYDNKDDIFNTNNKLDIECIRQVTLTYKNLVRGGALLSDSGKAKYNNILNKLTKLKNDFSHNVLKATDSWFYHTENEDDLIGLSDNLKNAAKKEAENRKLNGFVLVLKGGFYNDFMITSKNRKLRKLLFKAKSNLCLDGKYSNKKIIKRISKLRYKKAKLLGYDRFGFCIFSYGCVFNPCGVRGKRQKGNDC
jgi:Zn-dependent oligopeptidase